MKLLDKNFRLFGVVSVIDIVIVIALIVFVLLALRFSAPQSAAAKPGDVPIRYTVEIQRRPPAFKDMIKVGDSVIDSQRGYQIGTIAGVSSKTYLEDSPDVAGNMIKTAQVDGLEAVYIEIDAKAQITDYTTLIGSFEVLVGKEIYIRTKSFAAGGYVVAIKRGDAS